MKNSVNEARKGEQEQDLTEQALLLVLIALASVTAMRRLGATIQTVYNTPPGDPTVTT